MKTIIGLFVSLLMCMQSAWAALPTKQDAVAVMDFGTRPGATTSEISIHNAEYTSSEYVINRLVDRQYFAVKEKELVMDHLKQNNLKTTGLIDPDTAKYIGNLLGVRYLIYGNVANVSVSETGTQIMTNIGGGINICTVKAHMVGRMMDVETGDILMAVRGDGQSKSSYVNLRAGTDLTTVHTVKIGTAKVTQDSVHNAIKKAAEIMVDNMIAVASGEPLPPKNGKSKKEVKQKEKPAKEAKDKKDKKEKK